MHLWLASLAIVFVITTTSSHQGLGDSPISIQNTTNETEQNICVKQECYDTASRIKNAMNLEVNPCDDFYEYTCGGLFKNAAIANETVITNNFDSIETQLDLQLKSIFEIDEEIGDIRPFKLVKSVYRSCMNKDSIEAAGVAPLKELIRAWGGWPVLEGNSWNESNFDWAATPAEWARVGMRSTAFLNIHIGHDTLDDFRHAVHVDPPSWIIDRHNLEQGFNETILIRAYYTLMVDIAVSLGADRKKAEDELKEALLFQIELNKLITAANPEYLRMTLQELIERYPRGDWKDTFARMYSPILTMDDDDVIVVQAPAFIDQVIELVSKTPKRIQANYALFQIIPEAVALVNREIIQKFKKYQSAYGIAIKSNPRWTVCISIIKRDMPLSVLAMYVKKFFTIEMKTKVEEMLKEIRKEFRANLDKVSFFDNETRGFAKSKETAMKSFVGAPKDILDNDKLEDYYRDLELFENRFFASYLHVLKFNYDHQVRSFRKPVNKTDWKKMAQFLLNSGVTSLRNLNSISVPVSNLQGPFFHPERPGYMNFATIGSIIALEITYLFDKVGSYYDKNGHTNFWWTLATREAFQEQGKCFLEQYENYTKNKVSASLSLYDNIADNGGVKIAYHAYINSMRGKLPEKRLPGLDYSPNKMFWITFGNVFCEKLTAESSNISRTFNVRLANRFRVIGSVSNSEEFAKDFECPLGSKMNPIKKCSIW